MSGPVGSSTWFGEPGYNLDQSLRLNDGDSAYLSKTFASAGNRRTYTWSGWVKRSELGSENTFFGAGDGGSVFDEIKFDSSDRLSFYTYQSAVQGNRTTTAVFRDTSAWLHIVAVYDSTQSTALNRMKLYVNGEQITDLATTTNPEQNHQGNINAAIIHAVGAVYAGQLYNPFDGYLAEVNFIDGSAKAASDFGETGDYGEWKPIEYTGAYGTNGFHLDFSGEGIMLATGGNTIATDGDYKVHSFTSSGTFTPTIVPGTKAFVEYLVIGGGGGGSGGGGGAGGYRTGYLDVAQGTGLTVTVGADTPGGGAASNDGTVGNNSVFSTITSLGGGQAGGGDPGPGHDGGSGGGGGGGNGGVVGGGQNNPGGASTNGNGNAGGYGWTDANSYGIGGGGGGAGAAGSNAAEGGPGGNGGNGLASSITGSSVTRAGGGGGGGATGGGNKNGGSAGSGGAGAGGNNNAVGANATANTGSGGGGGGGSSNGGRGASGIVILRYKFQ